MKFVTVVVFCCCLLYLRPRREIKSKSFLIRGVGKFLVPTMKIKKCQKREFKRRFENEFFNSISELFVLNGHKG
jgi:hypothetical protein